MKDRRFTITLNAGIEPERKLLDFLLSHPKQRRQVKIRQLLVLGVETTDGRPYYNSFDYSGLERSSQRIGIRLMADARDDHPILSAIKDIHENFQPQLIKAAIVYGFKAYEKELASRKPKNAYPIEPRNSNLSANGHAKIPAQRLESCILGRASFEHLSTHPNEAALASNLSERSELDDRSHSDSSELSYDSTAEAVGHPSPKLPGLLNLFQ